MLDESGVPGSDSSGCSDAVLSRAAVSDADFRDRVIYFIVLDRFSSGQDSNLKMETGLDDPAHKDWNKYWGGDLQGLLNQLDYLKELGISAIWITPLFEQIESIVMEHGHDRAPMHGYWTKDFKRINSRWVNEESEVRILTNHDTIFDRLLRAMHERKMKFIPDFVCNHKGRRSDYRYRGEKCPCHSSSRIPYRRKPGSEISDQWCSNVCGRQSGHHRQLSRTWRVGSPLRIPVRVHKL